VKFFIASIVFLTFMKCEPGKDIICKKDFFKCAQTCSDICTRTINKNHEFGKCFSICNRPCRKEYCEEIKKTPL
jgi:hypothetical protein